jgi:pantoate--beta-alanine ligase
VRSLREKDGLAMSPSETVLKPEHRKSHLYTKTLKAKKQFDTKALKVRTEWVQKQFANHELLELEYFYYCR